MPVLAGDRSGRSETRSRNDQAETIKQKGQMSAPVNRATVYSRATCALAIAAAGLAYGQERPSTVSGAADVAAGHSLHGDAFNEGPRQKAYLMHGMHGMHGTGKVRFPVTTDVPLAQRFVEQGIGQLHGFWYFEAERSFRQAAALDPNCAVAYWGMAMANVNNAARAAAFIKEAAKRKQSAGPREQLWIDSLSAFYAEQDDKKRRRAYVRALEKIVWSYPADLEAKAFLALQIWENSHHGLEIPSREAVDALMEQVLAAEPMHPLHHYRIHLWDSPEAERALSSAARSGQSAPSIAHMWHMGGHIFSDLHRYQDAAWQQEASARVDHAQMMRDRVLPDQIHNYAHNNEWLIRNLSHVGRVHDAVELAKNMLELPRHPKYNTLSRGGSSANYGRTRLLETLQRYELWDEIVTLCGTTYLEPTDDLDEQVRRLAALGAAYWNRGDRAHGAEQIDALERLIQQQKTARQQAGDAAEARALKDKLTPDAARNARKEAQDGFAAKLRRIETARKELDLYRALAEGKTAAARASVEELSEMPKELRARLLVQVGEPEKAEKLAREAVHDSPFLVQPLANLVHVLYQTGKKQEAVQELQKLRPLCSYADMDVPAFERLAPVVRAAGLPSDWRLPIVSRTDVGKRPQLSRLGPFRWQPAPAPSWALKAADGSTLSLEKFRGKPVILLFYLGSGCIHCVEQLSLFAPAAPKFAAAGISLVAISTEPVESLKQTLPQPGAAPLPFPLLSDRAMRIFKAYRAFDDFENRPLHGAFLIDGTGLIRWQDISYEPFREADFLLTEAKRLLATPVSSQSAGHTPVGRPTSRTSARVATRR